MFYKNIHTIIFDFDGVFTNNKVQVDQNGIESVICNRGDGLGLNILNSFKKENNWKLDLFILSSEVNPVVSVRAKKLKIKVNTGVKNKLNYISSYLEKRFDKKKNMFKGVIYIGNDLNDLSIMLKAGISYAPFDAHQRIKKIATKVFRTKGGDGFVRDVIEHILEIKKLKTKNLEKLLKSS